jgi:predicted CXXCH cytochrome family protein
VRRALAVAMLASAVAAMGAAWAASGLQPAVEPARGGTCVADPATMRREHMNLLRHQRDQTVHAGVRQAPASLKGCVACHASRATGSVAAAKTDFCVSCHGYAAVKIDCFECHASRPDGAARLAQGQR